MCDPKLRPKFAQTCTASGPRYPESRVGQRRSVPGDFARGVYLQQYSANCTGSAQLSCQATAWVGGRAGAGPRLRSLFPPPAACARPPRLARAPPAGGGGCGRWRRAHALSPPPAGSRSRVRAEAAVAAAAAAAAAEESRGEGREGGGWGGWPGPSGRSYRSRHLSSSDGVGGDAGCSSPLRR